MGPVSTEYSQIGPGFASFVVVFGLALALWFLLRHMNTRLRNVSYREQQEREQQEHAQDGRGAASAEDVTRAGR